MKKQIKTYLPLFSGFYNTLWDHEIDSYEQEQEYGGSVFDKLKIDISKLDLNCVELPINIDYAKYHEAMSKAIVDGVNNLIEIDGLSFEYESLSSPREYNFSNDSINVIANIKAAGKFHKFIVSYLNQNAEAWGGYLEDRYSSCDGFISSYPNTISGWKDETSNYTELDGHYLGSILEFYCNNEGIDEQDIEQYTEKVSLMEYVDFDIGNLKTKAIAGAQKLANDIETCEKQYHAYIELMKIDPSSEKANNIRNTHGRGMREYTNELIELIRG